MLSEFIFKIKSIFHLVSDSFMDSLIFIGQAVIHWAMLSSGITSSEILQLDLRLLLDSWRTPFSEKKNDVLTNQKYRIQNFLDFTDWLSDLKTCLWTFKAKFFQKNFRVVQNFSRKLSGCGPTHGSGRVDFQEIWNFVLKFFFIFQTRLGQKLGRFCPFFVQLKSLIDISFVQIRYHVVW